MNWKPYAKAFVAAAVAGAGYLSGILVGLDPAAGFADITTAQWLGLVPALAAGGGITWAVPNADG